MDQQAPLRRHLVNLLTKGEAHLDVRAVLSDFPARLRGRKPKGAPHTAWQLLEHLRLAQWDILRFSLDSDHVSPKWPDEYWPKQAAPTNPKAWQASVQAFFKDLNAVCRMVRNPKHDLYAAIPHGSGQTMLREALLVADHNAYHLGQIVMLRKMLEKR